MAAFRKILFWSHLSCGVIAGLVVLVLSVTGVILTYERQMIAATQQTFSPSFPEQIRLDVDELLARAAQEPNFTATTITLSREPNLPVVLRAGRNDSRWQNPYSGELLTPHKSGLEEFFGLVTRVHRWFNLEGKSRETGKAITGVSNLMFLFLLISGLYLWLPKMYRWSAFKLRLSFVSAPNSAARDFNWHHVMGIWAAIPLLIIICSGTVFGYGWASNLVYQLAGETPPPRGAGPGPNANEKTENEDLRGEQYPTLPMSKLMAAATIHVDDWQSMTITLPANNATSLSISTDSGNGGQPQRKITLEFDRQNGEIVSAVPFSSLSTGRQWRSWLRYLHTGEALGLIGQTIAGLASFAAVIMVWTGLALAFRRMQRSLKRKRTAQLATTS